MKYINSDTSNKIGLIFNPKIELRTSEGSGVLEQISRHIRHIKKYKKACVTVLRRFTHTMTALYTFLTRT